MFARHTRALLLRILMGVIFAGVGISQSPGQTSGASDDSSRMKAASIIRKAREWIGPEERIDEIQTLRYSGEIIQYEDQGSRKGSFSMSFRKPDSQLVVITFPDVETITGFNGYEGFNKIVSRTESGSFETEVQSMTSYEVRQFRATTLENLYFFRPFPPEERNPLYAGIRMDDGNETEILIYNHPGGFTFSRQIDKATGRLIRTINPSGIETIEEGETLIGGLRFPTRIIGRSNGSTLYELKPLSIQINPELSENLFDYPRE